MSRFRRASARATGAASARLRGLLLLPVLALRNRTSREKVVDVDGDPRVAVCLTTYGVRLRNVHLVVESIARGRVRPSLLILWLSHPDAAGPLPPGLRRLQARGLSIRVCDDFGSHKKYLPFATGPEADDHLLVTADDDVYYPRGWLSGLLSCWRADSGVVWCYRARTMVFDGGEIATYRRWPLAHDGGPSFGLVPTGVSGVLYPPVLVEEMRRRGAASVTLAPNADDLWLHALAVSRGTPVRLVPGRPRHCAVPPTAKGTGLMSENLSGGNDRVVARLYDRGLRQRIRRGAEGRPSVP